MLSLLKRPTLQSVPYATVGATGVLIDATLSPYNVRADGTTCTTGLNAAITAANAVGGGCVLLPYGTIRATALMKSYVQLKGRGKGATTLKRPDADTSSDVIALATARVEQIEIADLTIHGNKDAVGVTAGHGITLTTDSASNGAFASGFNNPRHKVSNVLIRNCKQDGLHLGGDTYAGACEYTGVQIYSCDGHGIDAQSPDNIFTNCDVGQSGKNGINDSGYNRFVGCKAWISGRISLGADGTGNGFKCATNSQFVGCTAQDNARHGFDLFNKTGITVSGCTADTNGTQVYGVGFNLNTASNCVVNGSAFDRGGDSGLNAAVQQYGVDLTSATKNVVNLANGTEVHGAYPGFPGSPGDNAVTVNGTPSINYIAHTESSHIDSGRLAAGLTPTGVDNMRRHDANTGLTTVNGELWVSYLTSPISFAFTKLAFATRGTAQVGASLLRYGLYTVDGSGNLTLVARTDSDTALLNATFNEFQKALSATGGYVTSYTLLAGTRYAFGLIVVGSSTAPVIYGNAPLTAWASRTPALGHKVAGQTDLPTSVAVGSLVAHGNVPYAVALA